MEPSSVAVPRRVGRARLDAWLGTIIGGLLVAILLAGPLLTGALSDRDFAWIQVLGSLAAALWALRLWLTPRPTFLPPIVWPLLAFCVYAIVRYFTSDVEYLARKEVVRVLFYMMFFGLALDHFQNAKLADAAIAILAGLGMALSVFALRQYLTGTNMIWNLVRPSYNFRGSGTFIYPNNFAAWCEMLLALGLAYVFIGTVPKWVRIFLAYCCLWLVLGIYVSFSRAGWLATVFTLLVLSTVFLRNRQRQIIAFSLLVLLVIAGLAWELKTRELTKRLTGFGGDNPTSGLNMRKYLWQGAYGIWRDHPLWGGGPGHFDERFPMYRSKHFQLRPGYAHSDYLNVLADWGAVGAGLLFCAILLYLLPAGRNWLKAVLDPASLQATISNNLAITPGSFAGIVGVLAHALLDYQWYMPGVMLTFIAVVAIGLCSLQASRFQFAAPRLVSLVILLLIIVQTVQAGKSFRESRWLNNANTAKTMSDRIASLNHAIQVEPTNFQTAYMIGECYRSASWEGAENYRELAEKAIPWFDRSARLNPFDPYPHLRKAMCLDWLKRHTEAETEIQTALVLDPEYYFVLAIAGWHYFQAGNDTAALKYLTASLERNWHNNPVAEQYLRWTRERVEAKRR